MKALVVLAFLAFPAFGWEWGIQNPDGSQDTYNPWTGVWEYGFQNPDGSQDTWRTPGFSRDDRDWGWEYGVRNLDGSQDTWREW